LSKTHRFKFSVSIPEVVDALQGPHEFTVTATTVKEEKVQTKNYKFTLKVSDPDCEPPKTWTPDSMHLKKLNVPLLSF